MYSKKQLGEDLKFILSKPHDVINIARWAEHNYTTRCRDFHPN